MPSLYAMAVTPIIRGLQNASAILTHAENYAKTNNIDPQDYLTARLHPDMADFPYQIYRFTDFARFTTTRLTNIPGISLPDVEKDFPSLIARVNTTIDYLTAVDPAAFDSIDEEKEIVLHMGPGGNVELKITPVDYLNYYAIPNFWFHVTTMYGILRMKGVDLGKMNFINGAGLVKYTMPKKKEKEEEE